VIPHPLQFLLVGDERERLLRLGILRVLCLSHLGPNYPLLAALAKAAADSTADMLVLDLLNAVPAPARRKILASFGELTMPARTRR
jgi:hypothetical protein